MVVIETPTEYPDAATRVELGMAFLDQHVPGWLEWVDPETIDIADCETCVYGVLFHGFDPGERFGIDPALYGFERVPFERYEELTSAWVEAILERDGAA